MKRSLGICFVLMAFACAESSSFKGGTNIAKAPAVPEQSAPTPEVYEGEANPVEAPQEADAAPEVIPVPTIDAPVESDIVSGEIESIPLVLELTLPVPEVRAGGETVQTEVKLSGPSDSEIEYKVIGPAGADLGSISDGGLYTSPAALSDAIEIQIVATLKSDPRSTDTKTLKLIPEDVIFVGCKVGNASFPITADVFQLAVNTQRLPADYSVLTKSTTVCMDRYDVPTRNFSEGFPDVPALFEWFSLHTRSKIIIPAAGTYKFRLFSDDGSKLYIDGRQIIDHDGTHSPSAKDGQATLTAGVHELVLDYFQGPRTQIALQLFWQQPTDSGFVLVPASAFSE